MDLKDQLKQLKPRGGKVRIQQKYPRRVQRIYQAELQKMLAGITRKLNEQIKPMIRDELRTDSKADVIRAIAAIADLSLSPEALARRIAIAVRDSNDNTIRRAVERAVGVNILTPGSALTEATELWVVENSALITNLRDDHLKRIQGTVTRGFQRGLTSGEIAKQINADTGVGMRRAKLIARDQVGTLNAQITEARDKELGIERYIWRNSQDRRVRGNPSGLYPDAKYNHWSREGKEYSWDNPPPDGHPGEPVQCFPGSTTFNMANGCHKFWRRRYKGSLSSIVASSGILLEATPNHPILSRGEWKPINQLKQGDDIIQSASYGSGIQKPNVNSFLANADEMFDFMRSAGSLATRPGTKLDFHCDGSKENIDTVLIESLLSNAEMASFAERSSKLGFAGACVDIDFTKLNPCGFSVHSVMAVLFALYRSVGGGSQCDAGFFGHGAHPDKVGLAGGSAWDSVVSKYAADHAAVNLVLIRQGKHADTVGVVGDNLALWQVGDFIVCRSSLSSGGIDASGSEVLAKTVALYPDADAYFFEQDARLYERLSVVENRIRDFSGHVYNIQTYSNWYEANSIVSHNCRCYAEAVIEF